MPADRLSTLAFRNLPALAARARRIVEENRRGFADFLRSEHRLECAPTRATLAFPRLSGVADAGPFVDRLFTETGTAVAPGRFFGAPAHFRVAFGGEPSRVREGLERIRRCLRSA
jgi:aspartate/methionine/tyrosine aminotransferase